VKQSKQLIDNLTKKKLSLKVYLFEIVRQANCLFDIFWVKAGHIVFKAANGKYAMAAATGHMRAVSDNVTDLEIFRISLVNRPILVLKCEYGKYLKEKLLIKKKSVLIQIHFLRTRWLQE